MLHCVTDICVHTCGPCGCHAMSSFTVWKHTMQVALALLPDVNAEYMLNFRTDTPSQQFSLRFANCGGEVVATSLRHQGPHTTTDLFN